MATANSTAPSAAPTVSPSIPIQLARAANIKKARLSDYNDIATALDVPLWVLMIPGLDRHPELIERDRMKRFVALVENYLACNNAQRADTELVALTGAVVRRVGGAS